MSKMSNHISVRAVKLNFRMVEDILSVFKPEGAALVSTCLETMQNLITAAVIVLEEVVRLLQRDSEVHQVAKDSQHEEHG